MSSYFWFTIFKDMDHNTLIVVFLITFTIYIISTYLKFKTEEELKSENNKDDNK